MKALYSTGYNFELSVEVFALKIQPESITMCNFSLRCLGLISFSILTIQEGYATQFSTFLSETTPQTTLPQFQDVKEAVVSGDDSASTAHDRPFFAQDITSQYSRDEVLLARSSVVDAVESPALPPDLMSSLSRQNNESSAFVAGSVVVLSQADPSQNRFPDEETFPGPVDLPQLDDEEIQPLEELPPAEVEASTPFVVTAIDVAGSTVFSETQLRDVALRSLLGLEIDGQTEVELPTAGLEITLSELQQAANAVTNYYLTAGYITSRATIPEQTIADGVVRIEVLEGMLEEIRIEGTERLTDYVRSRIGLAAGTPVNAQDLEGQLRLLRADQLFDEVKADLLRGTQLGASILLVTVEEANAVQGSIGVDTQSPLSVGRYRAGATLQYLNLTGLGDRLSASANVTTTGGSENYELSYQIPISPMDGYVLLRYAPSKFRITNSDAADGVEANGSADIYEILVRQPLIRTFEEEFALSLGFRYREGSSIVGGRVLPPLETSVLTVGQDYLHRDAQGSWALRSQFRIGTGLFGATTRPSSQPDGQFVLWAGQAQRIQQLSPKHLLVLQLDTQFTGDELVGSEQFFIGGPTSVRGYFQNQKFGDNGVRFSISDYITLLRSDENLPTVQLVPFVDTAYAWFNNADMQRFSGNNNFLLSTGIGLVVNPVEGLNASVDLGVPLVSVDGSPDVLVDFNIRYRF